MTRPLRIAFVAYRGNMHCGGQGIYLWFLARELSRRGHQVDVLVGPPYPDPMPFAHRVVQLPNQQFWAGWFNRDRARMLPEGAPLGVFSPLHFYELAASRLGFLPEPFAFSWRAHAELSRRIRSGSRWDLIHDVQCLGYGLLAMRALGMAVVSTVHHPLSVDRRASFERDRTFRDAVGSMQFYPVGMQAFVARRLDAVLTSSEASARRITSDFRVDRDRIANVGNGLDTELFCPDAQVARSETEILCIGRSSDPNKGIRTLIRALCQLPSQIKLSLVDTDQPDNPAFGWARAAGVADRLVVTGRLSTEELVQRYRRAALVVVPSRYEGFGLPAVEAMACGTPVVACAAGALPEVLAAGAGGVLAASDDPAALARAVADLLGRPERRAELGRSGRAGVASVFAWPRIAERTEQVYRAVLAERRGLPASTITSASPGTRRATWSSA